jgi:hypothetical protein
MPKQQKAGIPLRPNGQPDRRFTGPHVITARGFRDQRGSRTLSAKAQKRTELLADRLNKPRKPCTETLGGIYARQGGA